MFQKNEKNNEASSVEKRLKDMNRKTEYPVVNRNSLQDYDALRVKKWVEEHEL